MNIQEVNEYIKSKVPSAKIPGFRINFGDKEEFSVEEADELIEFLNKLEKQRGSSVKHNNLITKTKNRPNEGAAKYREKSSDLPIREFVRRRNEALFSLDRSKIEAFFKEREGDYPENDLEFWAGVYKMLFAITSTPEELKEKARNWLTCHGFSTEICFI